MSETNAPAQLDDFFNDADLEVADVLEGEPAIMPNVEEAPRPAIGGLDLSCLSNMPGVVVGGTGTVEVQRFPVERIKFKAESKERFSILSDQVIVVKTHYDKDIGSNFICFEGDCCSLGLARVRYVYPVLMYDTDLEGKVLSKKYRFACICITEQQYAALQTVQEVKGSLVGLDFLSTCTDTKFQTVSFTELGNSLWPQIEGCSQAMNDYWNKNMKDILKGVARDITPEEYKKLKGADFAEPAASVDFNEVFGR